MTQRCTTSRASRSRGEVRKRTPWVPRPSRIPRLRQIILSLRDEVNDLRRAFDCLPAALAIVDHAGGVICANAAADALFLERDGLRNERGRLSASLPSESRALSKVIAQSAAVASARTSSAPVSAPRPATGAISRNERRKMSVVCLPLRDRSSDRDGPPGGARVLVVVHDPEQVLRLDPMLLARLHGLSATEGLLAAALAEGQSLAEFASERGCSEHTARTHLKHIFDKTQTSRQADLVRVLLTGAVFRHVG